MTTSRPGSSSSPTRRGIGSVDLHAALEAMRNELQCLLGPAIRLELRRLPNASSGRALARRGEVVDLLRHLALDAHDAMPAGGAVSICTGRLRVAGASPDAQPVDCAALVMREVSDAPRTRIGGAPGRIRKGRSLGLGASYDAIERLGGHLCVSCLGRETVVTISFPPAE